jgi:hypothetical protein
MLRVFFDRVKESKRKKWDNINEQSDGSLFKLASSRSKNHGDSTARTNYIHLQSNSLDTGIVDSILEQGGKSVPAKEKIN